MKYHFGRNRFLLNFDIKELIRFVLSIILGLLISFVLAKIAGVQFKWWIAVGSLVGGYIGSRIFRKKA